jgi:hypothetical protein
MQNVVRVCLLYATGLREKMNRGEWLAASDRAVFDDDVLVDVRKKANAGWGGEDPGGEEVLRAAKWA